MDESGLWPYEEERIEQLGEWPDIDLPFTDNEPLECGLENPEICESCQ